MASFSQNANLTALTAFLPSGVLRNAEAYRQTYEANRHRVYALAFWMTDNELEAEDIMCETFTRAFAANANASPEEIDEALVGVLRQAMTIGELTLRCQPAAKVFDVRKNTKRIDLERAVVQLPPTERLVFLMHDVEGYSHDRISRTLGLSDEASQIALHESRLRVRELLSKMVM